MRLLERMIFNELVRVFLAVLLVTTCLLVFAGVFSQVKENGLGPWQVIQILPFVVPSLLPYTIPATALLSVCVVYGRMSGDREVIAAKAAGIHVFSLLWPSYFLGAILSVCALLLTDQVIPWSFANIERTVTLAMEDIFLDVLRNQNQIYMKERGITITVMDVKDRTLIFPTFRYSPTGRSAVTMQAREARIDFDLARQEVILTMKHGFIEMPGGNRLSFAEEKKPFPLPSKRGRVRARTLRMSEIQQEITKATEEQQLARQRQAIETAFILSRGSFEQFSETGFVDHAVQTKLAKEKFHQLNTEIHNRFATSCSCFFFVLLGSPFSILMARKQFLTSFLFCFLPILSVYYPVSMMTQNLSKTGRLDPAYAVWTANGIMLLVSLSLFNRVLKN